MRKIAALIILIVTVNHLSSQVEYPFAISPGILNILYIGVDNPIDIGVFGLNPEDITVKISKGEIREDGRGSYSVRVKEEGITEISIYKNDQYIGGKIFSVKVLPDPYACVGSGNNCITNEKIDKNVLLAFTGICTKLDLNIEVQFRVTNFLLTTAVHGENIREQSNSNKFTPKQKNLIQRTMRGTDIVIDEIKCIGPDGLTRTLNPIIITIK